MVILLDGGFSSQVRKYADEKIMLDSPLWCSQFLASNPDAVVQAHSDYITAGCDVVSTNTYQASVDGFEKHLGLDHNSSVALIKQAVQLAHKAVKQSANGRRVLVAGSVGAYGASLGDGSEYRGEYIERVTSDQLIAWHRPRIKALVEGGVDLLAIETIPALAEAVAVLQLLKDEFPMQKAWVSFTCKDSEHISHGERFSEAVAQCCKVNRTQLVAVGTNCVSPALISPLFASAQGHQVPFIAYPNSGESWIPGVGYTNKEACVPLTNYLSDWVSLGAEFVGGCCRTTAEDIKLCREYIDLHSL